MHVHPMITFTVKSHGPCKYTTNAKQSSLKWKEDAGGRRGRGLFLCVEIEFFFVGWILSIQRVSTYEAQSVCSVVPCVKMLIVKTRRKWKVVKKLPLLMRQHLHAYQNAHCQDKKYVPLSFFALFPGAMCANKPLPLGWRGGGGFRV